MRPIPGAARRGRNDHESVTPSEGYLRRVPPVASPCLARRKQMARGGGPTSKTCGTAVSLDLFPFGPPSRVLTMRAPLGTQRDGPPLNGAEATLPELSSPSELNNRLTTAYA